MSDTFYREQAARRARQMWLFAGILISIACVSIGVVGVLRDDCTGTFDRNPEAVVRSYIGAITGDDPQGPRNCWERNAYYDLETGCSEICLSKALGESFQIENIQFQPEETTAEGRAKLQAEVTVSCGEGGASQSGVIMLDSISQNVPWQHWQIVYSDFGGTVAEPWCK